MFSIKAACMSDIGRRRKNNEDNFYFNGAFLPSDKTNMPYPYEMNALTDKPFVLAVYDGMGGENYGNVASFAAAKKRAEIEKQNSKIGNPAEYLNKTASDLNNEVVDNAKKLLVRNMGSTLLEVLFDNEKVYVSNMGDSRAYVLQSGNLKQLSVDHCDEGLARTRPDGTKVKAPLTRYLGVDPEEYIIEPDISERHIREGDIYLLCSDGLTDMIDEAAITAILSEKCTPAEKVEKLIKAALDGGGRDNITAIVCEVEKCNDVRPKNAVKNFAAFSKNGKIPGYTWIIAGVGIVIIILAILILTHVICINHSYSEASCTLPQTCVYCGKTEGDPLGHDYSDADCITPATCSRCEETTGEALGHEWSEADCTTPATCSRCGETDGEALGHKWADADCTTPKTCERCGETEGEALGHKWADVDCTTPKTCERCGETDGEALGHDWSDADCTNPAICSRCKETRGAALNHKWSEATCTSPATCERCGKTDGAALEHDWDEADCTNPKTCSRCGETDGDALDHEWVEADCKNPKTCSRCGETDGDALEHEWVEADCKNPKTCKLCGETDGEALEHEWVEADCTNPKTCKLCKETDGDALDHDLVEADCTSPAICNRCGETEGEALGHQMEPITVKFEGNYVIIGERCETCGRVTTTDINGKQKECMDYNSAQKKFDGIQDYILVPLKYDENRYGTYTDTIITDEVQMRYSWHEYEGGITPHAGDVPINSKVTVRLTYNDMSLVYKDGNYFWTNARNLEKTKAALKLTD